MKCLTAWFRISMVSNQDFTAPIEEILPKQRYSLKLDEGFHKKESLTSIWQFASV